MNWRIGLQFYVQKQTLLRVAECQDKCCQEILLLVLVTFPLTLSVEFSSEFKQQTNCECHQPFL